jgi:hypothetical protein
MRERTIGASMPLLSAEEPRVARWKPARRITSGRRRARGAAATLIAGPPMAPAKAKASGRRAIPTMSATVAGRTGSAYATARTPSTTRAADPNEFEWTRSTARRTSRPLRLTSPRRWTTAPHVVHLEAESAASTVRSWPDDARACRFVPFDHDHSIQLPSLPLAPDPPHRSHNRRRGPDRRCGRMLVERRPRPHGLRRNRR